MKNKFFNVLIVGAGKIGAFFDTPKSRDVLTHAHAFSLHKGFNLVGFVDSDFRKAKKASSIWGGRAFKSISQAFKEENIGVVCNATPDEAHFKVLKELLKYKPKFIFTEKPLVSDLKEAYDINQLVQKVDTRIAVNYRRRFVPEFKKIKLEIEKNKYGEYLAGNGYYTKGIVHNGSHALDLLRYFIGDIKGAIALGVGAQNISDPQITTTIKIQNKESHNKQFFLQNIDHKLYTIFELDLLFSKARIRIIDSGFKIETHKVKNDRMFKGYKNMEHDKLINTSLNKALYFAADNIYKNLIRKERLDCSFGDAYKVMSAVNRVLKSKK